MKTTVSHTKEHAAARRAAQKLAHGGFIGYGENNINGSAAIISAEYQPLVDAAKAVIKDARARWPDDAGQPYNNLAAQIKQLEREMKEYSIQSAPENKLLNVRWRGSYGVSKFAHGKWWDYTSPNPHARGRECATPDAWFGEYSESTPEIAKLRSALEQLEKEK